MWSIPNQQDSQLPLQYEQRNDQGTGNPTEQVRPTVTEYGQFRAPHLP